MSQRGEESSQPVKQLVKLYLLSLPALMHVSQKGTNDLPTQFLQFATERFGRKLAFYVFIIFLIAVG
jgi:hypothetical protein